MRQFAALVVVKHFPIDSVRCPPTSGRSHWEPHSRSKSANVDISYCNDTINIAFTAAGYSPDYLRMDLLTQHGFNQ